MGHGAPPWRAHDAAVQAVVFGSGQGLVVPFNEVVVDHAMQHLGALPAKAKVRAPGQPVQARLLVARQRRGPRQRERGSCAAMRRTDRTIGELLADLGVKFHRTGQSGIDEERYDIIAGIDAMAPEAVRRG